MASVSPQHLDELTSRLDSLLAKISSRTATTLGKAESRAQKLDVVTLDPFKGSGNLPRVAKRPPVPVQAKAMSLNLSHSNLDRAFERRPSVVELQDKGIMKTAPGVSAALIEKREQLEKQMKADALEQAMEKRASLSELQEKGIVKGVGGGVSAALIERAETLEKRFRRDSLEFAMEKRASLSELQDKGIIKGLPGVSPALIERAETLEKQMKLKALEQAMEKRASLSELQEKKIIKGTPGLSPALVDKAEQLEKQFLSAELEHSLGRRVSLSELAERGIVKGLGSGMSPVLVERAEQLQKQMRRDSLEQAMEKRASLSELQDKKIIKGALGVSPKIVEASERLDTRMKRDSISHALLARPPIAALKAKGILQDSASVDAAVAQERAERLGRGMEQPAVARASSLDMMLADTIEMANQEAKLAGRRASADASDAGASMAAVVRQAVEQARPQASAVPAAAWPVAGWATEGSPLFEEYVRLMGSDVKDCPLAGGIGSSDALLVIDMQNDFVPNHPKENPSGGKFGVAEGDLIEGSIASLISYFAQRGATVVATRDYHPHDHTSFLSEFGPFPSHCVQGSEGSKFRPEIARALSSTMRFYGQDKVMVAFKAMHEDVDSFGALPYASGGAGRITTRNSGKECGLACQMGCTAAPWTGSLILKQSNLCDDCINGEESSEIDVNAPPDIFAVVADGKERGLRNLHDTLRGKQRLFICGLSLDFCVLDTCLNGIDIGFSEVFMVLDAARAAHIPGVGSFGSGFLQDPHADVFLKLQSKSVKTISVHSITGQQRPPTVSKLGSVKANESDGMLGEYMTPFGLAAAKLDIRIELPSPGDSASMTYSVQSRKLAKMKLSNRGACSPMGRIPAGWHDVPTDATAVIFLYPMDGIAALQKRSQLGFLALTTSPELRLAAFGGYAFTNASGNVVGVQAIGQGDELNVSSGQSWRPEVLPSLHNAGRVQPVTIKRLSNAGATHFCWICPGEQFSVMNPKQRTRAPTDAAACNPACNSAEETWIPSATGGFLYFMKGANPVFYPLVLGGYL